MKYCTGCGTQQELHTRFCINCGTPLHPASAGLDADVPAPGQAAGPGPTSVSPSDLGPGPAAPAQVAQDLQSRWASTRPATGARGPLIVLGLALVVLLGGAGAVYALMNHPRQPAAAVAAPQTSATTTAATPGPALSLLAQPPPAHSATVAAAAAAATQISALLDDSSQARGVVGTATGGLAACTLPADQAVAELQAVVATRQRLLNQVATAPFEALPGGAALRSSLTAAWGASLSADQGYLAWAQNAQAVGTCPTDTANVFAANIAATQAKKTFVGLWNTNVSPVLHLPARKDGDL